MDFQELDVQLIADNDELKKIYIDLLKQKLEFDIAKIHAAIRDLRPSDQEKSPPPIARETF